MNDTSDMIIDFVTGRKVPDIGSEANRQRVERFLVNQKGFARRDIEVDKEIRFQVGGDVYCSCIDLVVSTDGGQSNCMVVRCAAGALGSWERETMAAARILEPHPIPFAVVSDGGTALVIDAMTGRKIGEGLSAVPTKDEAHAYLAQTRRHPLEKTRLERERIIFRSYDSMRVHVSRNLPCD